MAIAALKLYKERIAKTMTRAEKLFFLNQIDIYNYDAVIDFGGADGTLLWEVSKAYPEWRGQFIIIDNNPQMETAYEIPNCRRLISIDEASVFISENSWPTKILMICSSVLHECSSETVDAIIEFCKQFVQTLVMRDMSYSTDMFITRELSVTEDELAADPYLQQSYSIITHSADYERFKEHLQKCNEWHLRPEAIIAMWVLKCDYRENWANEVSENYFNNNIIRVARGLCSVNWLMQYNKSYALPYKASQAHFEFKYSLPDTHRQIILTRKETY